MASVLYNSFKEKILDNSIDIVDDEIRVILVTSDYSVNIDSHQEYSDITNEVSGTGYTSGGKILASQSLSLDNDNDRAEFHAGDVSWTNSTITASGIILYKYIDNSGSPASTSPLICFFDLDSAKFTINDTFKIEWNDNGIFYLS